MRRLADWFCGNARAARARAQDEHEAEVERLKREAARRTNPVKVRRLAAAKLAKLGSIGVALVGCHDLTPKQQEQVRVIECRVAAVKPLIEQVIDPEVFVREVMLGRIDAARALMNAGIEPKDVIDATKAWNACEPARPGPTTGA